MKKKFLALLALLYLSGCGYTTGSMLPPGKDTIHVENFKNKIAVASELSNRRVYYGYKPGMESTITTAVINEFVFDGNLRIASENTAHYILKGELVDFQRQPLEYNSEENVTQYRLRVVTNLELYDGETGELLWTEQGWAGQALYRTSGKYEQTDSQTLDEAIQDLARRVVDRTIEDW